jgi:Domain of unknown function (DUF4326)
MPVVKNKRFDVITPNDVYVGRPSIYGNPFRVAPNGDLRAGVEQYRKWLLAQPKLVARVKRELRGKNLVCWCAPQPCHADVLLAIANEDD